MDRISDLPNEIIICHIGCFLSAKEAAFAMVLSKRWRNLFTIVPELHYNRFRNRRSFDVFVDRVLAIPVTSRVNRFCLTWSRKDINPSRYDYINRCLRHVLKLGVLDLELRIDGTKGYTLPFEVFTSETVTKLTLGSDFAIDFLPEDALLPALKTLFLHSIWFYEFGSFSAFNTLLSACPVLEELNIYPLKKCKWSRIVSSPTIKRLTIHSDDFEFESISIDTPALVYLDYSNWAPKEYPVLNLNSLVEAKLDICKDESILSNPINLINGIKTVEILSLTDGMIELMHDFRESIPMFENLSHLKLMFNKKCCWFGLRVLLEKSPKLKTLIIQDGLHCNVKDGGFEPLCECLLGYSFLSTCRIEVLEIITRLEGDIGEMLHLKLIFENLQCLELLKLRVHGPDDDKGMKIKKDLSLMFNRVSSNCKIQIYDSFKQTWNLL